MGNKALQPTILSSPRHGKTVVTDANLTVGNSGKSGTFKGVCKASDFEELGAVIPHARICEGAVG